MAAGSNHIYPGCYGKTEILVGLLSSEITLMGEIWYTFLSVQVWKHLQIPLFHPNMASSGVDKTTGHRWCIGKVNNPSKEQSDCSLS